MKYLIIVLIMFLNTGCGIWPPYREWSKRYDGKAKLAEAEYSRQVLVQQAKAELEAAEMQAEAIRVVGEAAKKFPEYRTQMFIQSFGEAMKSDKIEQIIYVPTEANIPVMEANRFKH